MMGARRCLHAPRACFAGLIVAAVATPLHAEWLIDVAAGGMYDNNLSRAQNAADIRADGAATIRVAGTSLFVPSGFDTVTLGADVGGEAFNRYHGLDNIALGASAAWRHKFDLGFDAPWAMASARVAYYDFSNNLRDGARFALRAAIGKRFDEAADASIGVFYDRRYGGDEPVVPGLSGAVFDLRGQGAFLTGGYALTDQLRLGATVSVRRGDVESSTSPGFAIFVSSSAIALDTAFGDDLIAYRLRGTTWTASATASWALSDRSSINLFYTDEKTDVASGLNYRSRAATLTFVYSY